MHQSRRKKKRVNYGVRAVEVIRGAKGFGFTISGQQPCILSCIVQGSPAEGAGLRAGDYLVAVNGHNVSKVPHDDVVQLIGNSEGVLRLQIAENYYSDSSDEEGLATVRSKPKYAHKPRATNASALQLQCRAAKVVRDLQSGAMFHAAGGAAFSENKDQYNYSGLHYRWNMTSPLPPPPPPVSHKRDSEKIVHRTVVGYLGTIDIPNQLHPSSMMQVLRKCIKRLKAEKRNPTTVLLTIHVANIKLTNSENRIIAEYPSYRIIFCNSFSEQDKQYFGILTKSMKNTDDIVSNSCHVFTIYYKLIDHEVHSSACNVFGFTCTKSSELNVCQEFPDSCTSLIGAIQTLYISDCANGETNPYNEARVRLETASPQPSNISTSTAHSSNSDSGIGFKDDCGSCSGKITANNCGRRRQSASHMQYRNVNARSSRETVNGAAGHRLAVRATSEARWSKEFKFDLSKEMRRTAGSGESTTTTCAVTSAPVMATRSALASTSVGSLASVCTTALLDGIKDAAESSKTQEKLKRLMDTTNKLSPKVYCGQVFKSLVHSLEDINSSMEYARSSYCHSYSGKSDKPRPWGSLQEIRNSVSDNCIYGSTESCDKNNDCKGVHTWANGFEKLLGDPKGLQTFAEFLKKEFSHENIYFWAACERYKDTKDAALRRRLACQIYQRHLSSTAAEPVNVDSHAAGQITQELLDEAPADLFLQAQKQVFNLMKFDSYPRFLRSELYRACLEAGNAIVDTEDCDLHLTSSSSVKLKKSHSDAEDRCRKSILPWNRKNRSKSKDRGESEYNKAPSRGETIYKSFTTIKRETEGNNNEDTVSISSSRSSLASWDLALRQSFNKHSVSSCDGQTNEKKDARSKCTGLCRVILPDGSTTVVTTSQTDSIKDVVTRLLDKRALRYSNYDVLILATDEMVDTKYSSSVLAGQEVEVVLTKVLKVELPSRRIISVITHKGKTVKEVLKPLLNKYGFNLDLISIWSEGHCIPMDIMAINAPTRLIVVANEEDFQRELHTAKYLDEVPHVQPTLDEITNKVFEELLVGKSRSKYQYSEGSCKSDDQRSEGSSILSSKFFLRDSTIHGKKKAKSKCCNTSEKGNTNDCIHEGAPVKSQPPLIAKWRNGVKLQLPGRFDGDELYEGLKRAQRSRLEDQRGTEINFELPDFLKNKENGKPSDSNKMRRTRVMSANCEGTSKFYDSSEDKQSCSGYEYPAHVTNGTVVNERFSALVNITEPLSGCGASHHTSGQTSEDFADINAAINAASYTLDMTNVGITMPKESISNIHNIINQGLNHHILRDTELREYGHNKENDGATNDLYIPTPKTRCKKARCPLENCELNIYDNNRGISPIINKEKRRAFHVGAAVRRMSMDSQHNSESMMRSITSPSALSFPNLQSGRINFMRSLSSGYESMDDVNDLMNELIDMDSIDDKPQLPSGISKLLSGDIVAPETSMDCDVSTTPSYSRSDLQAKVKWLNSTPSLSKIRTCLFRSPTTTTCTPRTITRRYSYDEKSPMGYHLEAEISPQTTRAFKRTSEEMPMDETSILKKSRNAFYLNATPTSAQSSALARSKMQRSLSETEAHANIKWAIHRSATDSDLIGDFSKPCALPIMIGNHQDLKSITSDTLAALLRGEFDDRIHSYRIIDCRYPYEYEGGHITGSLNLYNMDLVERTLLEPLTTAVPKIQSDITKRNILVFHCEFSWERGPSLSRFLRRLDRERNKEHYPALHYPEIYLLHGGYEKFYSEQKDFCLPQNYKPMKHPDHDEEFRFFRSKSKSWQGDKAKGGSQTVVRPNLKRLGL